MKKLGALLLCAWFAVLCTACAPAELATQWLEGLIGGEAASAEAPVSAASSPAVFAQGAPAGQPYGYATLDEAGRAMYDKMLAGLVAHESRFAVDPYPVEEAFLLLRVLHMDHPELFWVGFDTGISFSITHDDTTLFMEPSYLCDATTREWRQAQLDAAAADILAGAPAEGAYEQVKYLYTTLVKRTAYEFGENDQNIYGVLVEGQAVCNGYAGTMQYLCNALGIPNLMVYGQLNGGDHAWNMVQLEGEYYHLDVTAGDPVGIEDRNFIDFDYLNLTEAEMSINHSIDSPYALPAAGATACNYYRREGLLFDSAEAAEAALPDLFAAWADAGDPYLQIRFSTAGAYADARLSLYENYGATGILQGVNARRGSNITNTSFMFNDELHTMLMVQVSR